MIFLFAVLWVMAVGLIFPAVLTLIVGITILISVAQVLICIFIGHPITNCRLCRLKQNRRFVHYLEQSLCGSDGLRVEYFPDRWSICCVRYPIHPGISLAGWNSYTILDIATDYFPLCRTRFYQNGFGSRVCVI